VRQGLSALFLLTFASVTLFAQRAAAHDPSVVVSLEDGTCVAQSALRDAVASRGGKISDDGTVRLRVRVRPRNDGQVGVEIGGDGAHGPLAERRFVASTCAAAVDALGLVVALAADEADRPLESARAASAAAAPMGDAPAAATPAPPAPPAPPGPVSRSEPKDAVPIVPSSSTSPPKSESTDPHTSLTLALRAGAIGTTLGEGQLGARVGASFEWRRTLLPWIEASGWMIFPRTIEGGGGGADATWTVGRFAIAPVGTVVGRTVRLSVFAAGDVGALNVSGSGAPRVESKTRPWFSVGGGARVRWDLAGRIFAGLDAACVIPLLRDDFVFINGGSAYRVPVIGAETGLFVGAHFP
jgi:hypothetical protein